VGAFAIKICKRKKLLINSAVCTHIINKEHKMDVHGILLWRVYVKCVHTFQCLLKYDNYGHLHEEQHAFLHLKRLRAMPASGIPSQPCNRVGNRPWWRYHPDGETKIPYQTYVIGPRQFCHHWCQYMSNYGCRARIAMLYFILKLPLPHLAHTGFRAHSASRSFSHG
jgi:hypothetical protein